MKSILIASLLFILPSALAWPGEPSNHTKPYFSVNPDEKLQLLTKAKAVQIGDTYDSVISRLGKPTYDRMMIRKDNREIIGRSLKYYIVRWEEGLVNEIHDQLVIIYFDTSDNVQKVILKIKED